MSRPGFIIPNAADAQKSSFIAEPDAGDFDILGHHTYGVWLGCDYTLLGNTFAITSPINVFEIKSQVYVTKADGASIRVPGSSGVSNRSRFDLFGLRLSSGAPTIHLVQGLGSPDRPVFPEIPDDMLVIASVYIPGAMGEWPGGTDISEYVTDKRVFLLSGAKGVAGPSEGFVVATDPSTGQNSFTIRGNGTMLFGNGSSITPDPVIPSRLNIVDTVYANNLAGTDLNISRDGNFGGNIAAANFVRGDGPPGPTTAGTTGAIYQDNLNGHIYVRNSVGDWDLLVPDGYPTGTIMQSVLPAAHPWLKGVWLLCDGRIITKEEAGMLWNAVASWQRGATQFQLPDLRQRVLMGAQSSGTIGELGGSNEYQLNENHLPRHTHGVTVGDSGAHSHDLVTSNAGGHNHGVNDPGHVHYPNWYPHPFTQFISNQWGGPWGIMGVQTAWNIVRHFYPDRANEPDGGVAVGSNPGTLLGMTGLTVVATGDHSHKANTSLQPAHGHNVSLSPTGVQSVVNNQQQYMTINYFIKN